ncbi:unnamed protein product [Anisakis simplex]|uniref:Conjugal transfer protein TraM n=1 Tax=Anisakis simplex TaxID=6269 RepID=A0A0M3JQ62_ANISI|nr:unnamed protein product [Anisakis simplex]
MSSAPSTPTMAVSNDFNVPMFSQTSAIIEEARADIERMKRSVAKGTHIQTDSNIFS